MPERPLPAAIFVLAGTNGAGKSSIGGEALRQAGVEFFDPDVVARRIRALQPTAPQDQVNSAAWHAGRRLLERAIAERRSFAFETTLGGATMTELLERAAGAGLELRIWYVGLATPALHLARVRARVARGGHDIPEADIRRRPRSRSRSTSRSPPTARACGSEGSPIVATSLACQPRPCRRA